MHPTLHIIDDDESFRTALMRVVQTFGFTTAIYASGEDFLSKLPVGESGCILLDLQMPGLHGSQLQVRLSEVAPLLPIIFLSGEGTVAAGVEAMKLGADDFLEKPVTSEKLLAAIGAALTRNQAKRLHQELLQSIQTRFSRLTPTEQLVFNFVVRGNRNKEIAYELHRTERTIKAHRQSLMNKLEVRTLAELIGIASALRNLQAKE